LPNSPVGMSELGGQGRGERGEGRGERGEGEQARFEMDRRSRRISIACVPRLSINSGTLISSSFTGIGRNAIRLKSRS